MPAYYNEIDPYAAQWLRNLISAGHIAPGDVDERSIIDVAADDLKSYTQAHFFAGIGGWSIALRLTGWPDDRRVWTGSCPCQPFSVAGKQKAQADERHLWPAWFRLIKSVKPPVLFGEQVAGAIAHGWLDDAFDDLEGEGYETAAAVLPACSVGAPHKRDRLWFVANARGAGRGTGLLRDSGNNRESTGPGWPVVAAESGEASALMAHSNNERSQGWNSPELSECSSQCTARSSSAPIPNANSEPQERSAIPRSECSFWGLEPAVGRVANGIPARSHKLRTYGNAIVPQVAAEFIKAYMACN